MANPKHVEILKQGTELWNEWRKTNPWVKPAFSEANLRQIKLTGANLNNADLSGTDLRAADLSGTNLIGADLSRTNLIRTDFLSAELMGANLVAANLRAANLIGADLSKADLRGANLNEADLSGANLHQADLSRADLNSADLSSADLSRANLTNANLERAILVDTILEETKLTGCRIYGVSVWNVNLKNAKQSNLIITHEDEPQITVDNLQVAQFIYLLLNNAEIRHVIDTITSKAVLILGRFTEERKAVLDAIRDELRKRDYLPIVFDFDKPANRDLTETIITLAGMSRFVIADLSDPHSIPHELMAFAEKLPNVPVKPIFCPIEAHPRPYPMLEHFRHYHWILPIYNYEDSAQLLASLIENVIEPAEAKVKELRAGK